MSEFTGTFADLRGQAAILRLSGGDRARYLQGQMSNDVRLVAPGRSVEGCVLTAKGKLCGLIRVLEDGESYLLLAEMILRENLLARLERYIVADDCLLEDETDRLAVLHLPGVTPEQARALAPDGAVLTEANRFGQTGMDVVATPEALDRCIERIRAAGGRGLTRAEQEFLRVRAGLPAWGRELDEDTLPAEAGLEGRAVSFSKGCYIGQEIVSRMKSSGKVRRALVRLTGPAEALTEGMELPDASGNPAGRITSLAPAPDSAPSLALALVRPAHAAPGTFLGPCQIIG